MAKPPLKERVRALIDEYGPIALVIYLAIFGVTVAFFYITISATWETDSASGTAGKLGAVWLAAKATQPARIAATFALTPFIARLIGKGPKSAPAGEAIEAATTAPDHE